MRYVALLRGINVGGNTVISMPELKKVFASLGFTDIVTILNSGNVVFTASEHGEEQLGQKIEKAIEERFGFSVRVMLKSESAILDLIQKDPFKAVVMTPTLRLNVTFIPQKNATPVALKDGEIIAQYDDALCTVIDLASGKGTPDVMKHIEKAYGKSTTTRTWKTMIRIEKALSV